jgi:hypothetical protein
MLSACRRCGRFDILWTDAINTRSTRA